MKFAFKRYPLPTGRFTIGQKFGPRGAVAGLPAGNHNGQDLPAPPNTPVLAPADGRVKGWGYEPDGFGWYVIIDHGNGHVTYYGHLIRKPKIRFRVGKKVRAGQRIGSVGSTGASTGSHLHFELRVNGTPVDPRPYLPKSLKVR